MFKKPASSDIEGLYTRRKFVTSAASSAALGVGAFALSGCIPKAVSEEKTANDSTQLSTYINGVNFPDQEAGVTQFVPYVVPSVASGDESERHKNILVVVDYQVDFVDGVFGRIEPAIAIEDGICDIIREYRARNDIIIYTMDTHPVEDYHLTREGFFNPPHCIPDTPGWDLYGKVQDLLNPDTATLIKKGTYGTPELVEVINGFKNQGITISSIEVAGVSTTCRVLHSAIILYNSFPEVDMVMDCRTTAAYTDEDTITTLETLEKWGFCIKW